MVCRNICLRSSSKMVVGQSHYSAGKKYSRRCECYFIAKMMFCECCGMQLRINQEDVSTIFSRKDCFVNAAECD
jgi:hypothetical protein